MEIAATTAREKVNATCIDLSRFWADISGYLSKSSFGRASLSPVFPFYPGRKQPLATVY